MSRRGTITVEVDADLDERSVRKVGQEAKALLEFIDTNLKVGATLDEQDVAKTIREVDRMLDAFHADFELNPNIDEKSLARVTAEIDEFTDLMDATVAVDVTLESETVVALQRRIRTLINIIEKTNKIELKIDPDPSLRQTMVGFFQHLGSDAGAAFGRGAQTGLGRFRVGDLLALLSPAASAVSALSGAFVSLASSIGFASAASLSYVGILGSLTQGLIVARSAFRGFGTVISTTDAKELAETLASMDPAARKLALGFRQLAKDLRWATQRTVFKGLEDSMNDVVTKFLPLLRKGFLDTAQVLNGFLRDFSGFITAKSFIDRFGQAMEGNNRILANLGKAAIPFLNGILNLYLALQPAAERFSQSIARAAQRFSDWSSEADRAEKIDDFMKRASHSAGLLFDVLGNLRRALGNIFSAALPAGDGFLEMLGRVTKRFENFTASTKGRNSIAAWAQSGVDAMGEFGGLLESLGRLFAKLSSPAVLQGLIDVLNTMVITLDRLNIEAVVENFGKLLSAVAPIIGPALAIGAAFAGMSSIMFVFRKTIEPVLKLFGGLFKLLAGSGGLGLGAGPAIGILALGAALVFAYKKSEAFRNAVDKGFKDIKAAIVPVFEQITSLINDQLIPAWEKIEPVVIPILEKIGTFLVNTLVAGIKGVIQAFSGFVSIISGAIKVVSSLLTGDLGGAWEGVKQIFKGAIDFIAGIFTAWLNFSIFGAVRKLFVKGVVGLFKAGWGLVGGVFKGALRFILGIFRGGMNAVLTVGRAAMGGLRGVIGRVWGAIVGLFRLYIGAVKTVFRTGFGVLKTIGRGAMEGVLNVVRSVLRKIRGAFDGMKNLGGKMWRGLTAGGKSAINGVVGLLNRLIGVMNAAIKGFNKLPKVDIPTIPTIPHLARGTRNFAGGLAVVGEQGRELVNLPKGSQVTPHRETEQALGGDVKIVQQFFGPTTSGGRLREMEWTARYATRARSYTTAGVATA